MECVLLVGASDRGPASVPPPAFLSLNSFPASLPVAILSRGFSLEVLTICVLGGRPLPEPSQRILGLTCVLQSS